MDNLSIKRKFSFDSSHRVLRHESKCRNLHGHRYDSIIEFSSKELDEIGRIWDFGEIKEIVGKWIDDNFDHNIILNNEDSELVRFILNDESHYKNPYILEGNPTAENIAIEMMKRLSLISPFKILSIELFETPNCSAKILNEKI
jgi:6-pyruvoyltetrahydropterin/6-carboxytetrahydropterin synthase